jgi:hypothetical protein
MADLYVSPRGNDAWSGRFPDPLADGSDGPKATLDGARQAVQALLHSQPPRDLLVMLRGGTYRMTQTVVFGLADSPARGHSVTYAAYADETPILSASQPITGWRRLSHYPPEIPAAARGHLWVANVGSPNDSPWSFRTLYDALGALPRAQSAGFQLPEAPRIAGPESVRQTSDTLSFPPGALRSWPNLEDIEILVRPSFAWTMNILGLAEVDETHHTARTLVPATYPLQRPHHFIDTIKASCWVENVLEYLDRPAMWVLDTRQGLLYLWPRSGWDEPEAIEAPTLCELLRVEGRIDADGPVDEPARGIVFRGLTLAHGDRSPLHPEDIGLQHDWALYDRDDALVRFRGAEDCRVLGCHLHDSGGTGVRLDLYAQRITIQGNLIEHLGGSGVLLAGYGPGTKDVNHHNRICDNTIHHIGELIWHAPAIFCWQSGYNAICHNLIYNTNYDGIVLSGVRPELLAGGGNPRERGTVRHHQIGPAADWLDLLGGRLAPDWQPSTFFVPYMARVRCYQHTRHNLVEANELHHVMSLLGDGNAIYLSDTDVGTIIRRNYIHDQVGLGGNSAIRTDEYTTGATMEENVVWRCVCGGLNLKHYDNHALNNVIGDVPDLVDVDVAGQPTRLSFGMISLVLADPPDRRPPGSEMQVQHNILEKTDIDRPFYRQWRVGGELQEGGLGFCDLGENLYYAPAETDQGGSHLARYRAHGLDLHSVVADPLFVDPANGDFRLQPGSPALALGIRSIDLCDVGPRPAERWDRIDGSE